MTSSLWVRIRLLLVAIVALSVSKVQPADASAIEDRPCSMNELCDSYGMLAEDCEECPGIVLACMVTGNGEIWFLGTCIEPNEWGCPGVAFCE